VEDIVQDYEVLDVDIDVHVQNYVEKEIFQEKQEIILEEKKNIQIGRKRACGFGGSGQDLGVIGGGGSG